MNDWYKLPLFASGTARAVCLLAISVCSLGVADDAPPVDVLVYGGTPAGIAAALAAAADNCSVLLVEPTARLGGLVTSGLSHTDFHSRESLSGAFADFARRVHKFYIQTYGPSSPQVRDCFGGTFAEPKVNLMVFEQMLAEYENIRILRNHRLFDAQVSPEDRASKSTAPPDSLTVNLQTLKSVTFVDTLSGHKQIIPFQVAIDATYEGDLMAMCGVPWRVGREGRHEYQESLAPDEADQQLQAYNFRFIMTRNPNNRVTPSAPFGYRRDDFLGVLAALESGEIATIFGYPSQCIFKAQTPPLPNEKYDINDVSRNIVRLSLPGENLAWPNGNEADRREIIQEHLRDQVGLLYFLQNDSAVPVQFQQEARQWGWCRDEFIDSEHLPPQLYVREARRMLGSHVYIQQDSEHAPGDARAVLHLDSIAMGDYGNNCHGTAHEGPRFAGKHTGEFYNPVPPYQIPYGVILPSTHTNLLVPTAVSASHVGYCALRLEPIWMSLGQAAGHAAALALADFSTGHPPLSVQTVAVRSLQRRLHQAGSATIYVSDVALDSPDFQAVQWWGAQGGLHGLAPMPETPGQRGANLHGQYYEANPGHTVELDRPLDLATADRWRAIAVLAGLKLERLPKISNSTTRGDFIRHAFEAAKQTGVDVLPACLPQQNPAALPNLHPPGEVDKLELVAKVVVDSATLSGIVVDDSEAILIGRWQYSAHTPPYVGRGYLHDMKAGKGEKSVTYIPYIPADGMYEIRLSHCYNIRRATNAWITVHHADGESEIRINQQDVPEHEGLFRTLGRFRMSSGTSNWVRISNKGTDGKHVIADAVQFLPLMPPPANR